MSLGIVGRRLEIATCEQLGLLAEPLDPALKMLFKSKETQTNRYWNMESEIWGGIVDCQSADEHPFW